MSSNFADPQANKNSTKNKSNLDVGQQHNFNKHHQQPQVSTLSNPMIVNSHPYNPNQQSQQQRCIGLNQQQQQQDHQIQPSLNRMLNMSSTGSSQQNSLYGSAFGQQQQQHQATMNQVSNTMLQSHMLDLANLQQSVFDPSYDVTTNTTTSANAINNMTDKARNKRPTCDIQQQQQVQNDISLYSPSSSTSLLYHIYDQINLPNEQQYQQTTADNNNGSSSSNNNNNNHHHHHLNGKKNTTILNPANLFSQQQPTNNLPLPLPMQIHQHQLSQVAELQKNMAQQQQCYSSSSSSTNNHSHYSSHLLQQQQQQQPFNTMHQHQPSYLSAHQNNLMLDTVIRQQHAATLARHHHQRPLSSSGASSMSGQSMPVAYGRQARTIGSQSGKSQNNLASVLQASNTLSHLGIGPSPSQLVTPNNCANGLFQTRWKRMNQRARHLAHEYRTIVKCSILLILLAFSLMSIIKFTFLSASSNSSSSPIQLLSATNSASQATSSQQQQQLGSNTLLYPPPFAKLDPNIGLLPPIGLTNSNDDNQAQRAAQQQDVLKSKLLIGEFVILSQNYSHSQPQKLLLAERIAKLMDQVFLSTDGEVRQVYSRMEVTNIRPNRPNGIVVDCNIILSDSIAWAAQQFGVALYDSLAKSHERLANQANYVIDKNSIRFNTVPDKDLRSGIVPPGLISPSVSRELALNPDQVAPSMGQPIVEPSFSQVNQSPMSQLGTSDSLEQMNQVVWSEWSQWSSCVDKNGQCDPTRLHSRLRKCVAQHTGEKVEASQCKQRFNIQDQELEVVDCSRSCSLQQQQQQQQQLQLQQQAPDSHIMSDAPSVIGPQTAPSVLVGDEPSFMGPLLSKPKMSAITSSVGTKDPSSNLANPTANSNLLELYTPSSSPVVATSSSSPSSVAGTGALAAASLGLSSSTTERSLTMASPANDILSSPLATPTLMPTLEQQQQHANSSQMSCSNCTNDEICLLLMQQKVPFCAKVKDRADESGCGGWCKAQNQLCQPVGQNAFKCIHDSECLAEEWRCHDSACIPLSKRCDGHSNCYDSSDERDCPI